MTESKTKEKKISSFLGIWGIAILLWIGVSYELYVLWPKIIKAIVTFL